MGKLSGERDVKAEISEMNKSYLGESEEGIQVVGEEREAQKLQGSQGS